MLNFIFIGCGDVAKFHADVIYGMGHQISAICARKQSPRIIPFAETYKIKKTYDNWQEMLNRESPDAIVVAVNWNQTELIIENIIKSGIPCLIEKPVARSSKKLIEIISATEKFNQNVLVGYNRRFYDFVPHLKRVIESEELISIELNIPEAIDFITKMHSSNITDHILLYMSSHWLDLLMYLIGDVRIDYMHRNEGEGKLNSYNGILYSLRYNVPVHLQANFNAPSQISMSFSFKDTIYKLCPIEMMTVYKGMERLEPDDKVKFRRYIPRVIETYEISADYKPGFYWQMKNFIATCVEHNQTNEIGCTLNDALKVTELCEQIKGKISI